MAHDDMDGMEPREKTYTRWHNPTDKAVVIKPWIGTEIQSRHDRSGRERYTIGPGETKQIPTMFDRAIQHDDGSGLAPQLIRLAPGEQPPKRKREPDPNTDGNTDGNGPKEPPKGQQGGGQRAGAQNT